MLKLIIFICLLPLTAFAQTQEQKEIQFVTNNLIVQRNQALDGVAVLQAKLQLAEEKIKELEAKLKALETKDKK